MPEKKTLDRAKKAKKQGKSPGTKPANLLERKSITFGRASMARVHRTSHRHWPVEGSPCGCEAGPS